MSLLALALTARAFFAARRRAARWRTRADVESWQARRLRRFMIHAAPAVDAFSHLKGRPWTDAPVMDKATLMAGFERYNRARVTAEEAWRALDGQSRVRGLWAGASTGTSGARGLYLVSDAERYAWLGVILAKALPEALTVAHRVAIVLPATSRLYDAANETGRLRLAFFGLGEGLDAVLPRVAAFRPTVIVAPPKVLRALAESDLALSVRKLFSAAEVLDEADRSVIEARFSLTLGQIYMATEGLFGVSCEAGRLHLAEDCAAFEWEAAGDSGLMAPIVTDFTRGRQVMLRYRMNDLLRLDPAPCPCGSPLQVASEVAGRMDDVFVLPRASGRGEVRVTPDILRNAVVGADRAITDFRILQTGGHAVRVLIPPGPATRLEASIRALESLFARLGARVEVTGRMQALEPPTDRKLRRVIRLMDAAP